MTEVDLSEMLVIGMVFGDSVLGVDGFGDAG